MLVFGPRKECFVWFGLSFGPVKLFLLNDNDAQFSCAFENDAQFLTFFLSSLCFLHFVKKTVNGTPYHIVSSLYEILPYFPFLCCSFV